MHKKEEILELLKTSKIILQKSYPISELGLFGSYAKDSYTDDSDIDILVDFNDRIDGFEFIKLAHEFEDILKHKVDLVSRKGIKPKYSP